MTEQQLLYVLGLGVVVFPSLLVAILGVTALISRPLGEAIIARVTQLSVVGGLLCAVAVLVLMLITGERNVPIEVGDWVVLHAEDFHFHLKFP